MSEIIKFPQKLCCQCEKRATNSIDLVDGDEEWRKFKKYFCDEHLPSNGDRA